MTGLVVALHGYEDAPERLRDALVSAIGASGSTWRVIAPTGPDRAPGGPSWFGPDGLADADRVARAVAIVRAAIDGDLARHRTADTVVVGGFSQGGALALAVALGPQPPGGIAVDGAFCLGGHLLGPDEATYDRHLARPPRVLVVHGADDEIVPVQLGRSAARTLERFDLDVELHEVATGHTVDDRLLEPVTPWLGALADARADARS